MRFGAAFANYGGELCFVCIASLGRRRFNRHPGGGRGPRPAQVVDYAEGVDTGLRRYGGKFELFRVSLTFNPNKGCHPAGDRVTSMRKK